MTPYLRQLIRCSDEDVAEIYLLALTFRNIYKRSSGIDLFNPQEAIEKHKTIALEISSHIRDAQKSTLYVNAAALKMWLFTIRSVMHDQLRPVGVALWREIPRGFPYVRAAAERSYQKTGVRFDITDCGMVPLGFESPKIETAI